jgi:hypothetical protein
MVSFLKPGFEPDYESDTQEDAYDVGEKFVRTEDENGGEGHGGGGNFGFLISDFGLSESVKV